MAKHTPTTPGSSPLPLTLIDLDSHPDGALLRLCAKLTKMQDRLDRPGGGLDGELCRDYWAAADRLAELHPQTADGFQMKALVALGMIAPAARQVRQMCGGRLSVWAGIVSVVNDVVRGLPA